MEFRSISTSLILNKLLRNSNFVTQKCFDTAWSAFFLSISHCLVKARPGRRPRRVSRAAQAKGMALPEMSELPAMAQLARSAFKK